MASPGPERGRKEGQEMKTGMRMNDGMRGLLYLQKTWQSCGSGVEPERSVAQAYAWSKCVSFAVILLSWFLFACCPLVGHKVRGGRGIFNDGQGMMVALRRKGASGEGGGESLGRGGISGWWCRRAGGRTEGSRRTDRSVAGTSSCRADGDC